MLFKLIAVLLSMVLLPASFESPTLKNQKFKVVIHDQELYAELQKSSTVFLAYGPLFSGRSQLVEMSAAFRNIKSLDIGEDIFVVKFTDDDRIVSLNRRNEVKITELRDGRVFQEMHLNFVNINNHEFHVDLYSNNIYFLRYPDRSCSENEYTIAMCAKLGMDHSDSFLDCQINESSINGDVIRQWSLADVLDASQYDQAFDMNMSVQNKWLDVFHCNSIDTKPGRILVSARNLNSIFELDTATGHVNWKIGGSNLDGKSIIDRSSNRKQLAISRQHDARYLGNNGISFFDNSTFIDRPARGIVIEFRNRRITRSINFVNPELSNSDCMGSFRAFDDGNWFVLGYGCSSEVATVFKSNGKAVVSLVQGPNKYNSPLYGIKTPFSYRVVTN
jgi:hypothetical protein